MPTNNALTAMLLWIVAGCAALLLSSVVLEAESSKHRGESRRVRLTFSGHQLLPSEIKRHAARFDNEQGLPELKHLSSQSLAAR
ncbi:MAG: hypothetical protein KDA59_14305 [Planctomycetales bacterium]|nr:hypothetical protein [Planctomycetales bacterium]